MIDEATLAILAERWMCGQHDHVLDEIAKQETHVQAAHAALAVGLLAGIDGPEQLLRAIEIRAEAEVRPTIPGLIAQGLEDLDW